MASSDVIITIRMLMIEKEVGGIIGKVTCLNTYCTVCIFIPGVWLLKYYVNMKISLS